MSASLLKEQLDAGSMDEVAFKLSTDEGLSAVLMRFCFTEGISFHYNH